MSLTASYVTTALRTSLSGNMSRLITICLVAVAAVGPTLVAADHPQYAYDYSVHDPHTGDNKAQWETRHGDAVKGSYSLVEPDGSLRVVNYHADDHSGFHADVKHLGPNLHPAPLVTKIGLPQGPLHLPTLTPIMPYGFGPAPHAIGLPPKTTFGHWNLPWDPLTSSFGGWVPLGYHGLPVYGPHATIYSKKWKNGKLYKWVTGPIPLTGRKLVIRTTKKH